MCCVMSTQTCFLDEDRLLSLLSGDIILWFTNDCTEIIDNVIRLKIISHKCTVYLYGECVCVYVCLLADMFVCE